MKPRHVIATLAAAALVGITAGSAEATALAINDPLGDTQTGKGSPSAAQKAVADLSKVEYWVYSTRFYIRWHVRDVRSDYAAPIISLEGKAGNIQFITENSGAAFVMGSYTYPNSTACHTRPTYDYTANTITAYFPRGCVRKGARFYPYGSDYYTNNAGTVEVHDTTAQGTSIVINP